MKPYLTRKPNKTLDAIGVVCSGACVLHCLSLPIAALVAPTFLSYFESEWIHLLLLVLVIPIAAISFYTQKKVHEQEAPMILGIVGIFFLSIALVSDPLLKVEIKGLEVILTTIGSFFLITGHIYNMKYLRGDLC